MVDFLISYPGIGTRVPAAVTFFPIWIATVLTPYGLNWFWVGWGFGVAVMAFLVFFTARKNDLLLFLFSVGFSFLIALHSSALLFLPASRQLEGPFLIEQSAESDYGPSFTLYDNQGKKWAWYPSTVDFKMGDWIEASFISVVSSSHKDQLLHQRARGIEGVVKLKGINKDQTYHRDWRTNFARWRNLLLEKSEEQPLRLRTLFRASFLGFRDPLGTEDYRRWGAAHLLAVSGWHVGVVAALCLILLGSSPLGLAMTFLAVGLYVALGGFALSAMRAFFMVSCQLYALGTGSKNLSLNSLFISLSLTLWLWPASPFSLSWQMSALATAWIILLRPWTWYGALAFPFVLWLAMAPLSSPLSGGLSLSSLVISYCLPVFGLIYLPCLGCAIWGVIGLPLRSFMYAVGEKTLGIWALAVDSWVEIFYRDFIVSRYHLSWVLSALIGWMCWRSSRSAMMTVFSTCLTAMVTLFFLKGVS